MFIDEARIYIKAGRGGDGAVAFRREKYVPKGGPAGGNGGNGGNVIFQANRNLHTLLDFQYKKKYEAEKGANGGTALKDGKFGKDVVVQVPVGTIIKNFETGEILCDLDEDGKSIVIAKGGKGGKGNSKFATPTNKAPRFAEEGKPGEEFYVSLELKLIADIGLVGLPNAGKSTFISAVSEARPKIADYPFTTLVPNLGIVRYKNYESFTVADIPGIIEGAHEGKGLGHQFLKHIERTKILLILIEANIDEIQFTYDTINNELKKYSELLAGKKKIVALTKIDLLSDEEIIKISKLKIKKYSGKVLLISSVTRTGIPEILDDLWSLLKS